MDVRAFSPKSLGECASIINGAILRKSLTIILGTCYLEYEGRGSSRSSEGDVVTLIKQDGSVIVHGPKGFKPLNWQPDTSYLSATLRDQELQVVALRRSPREVLRINCSKIYSIIEALGAVESAFWMYVNESEIRDLLAEMPELVEEGLRIVRVEKPVNPGFIDLYAVDSKGNLVIIEVKRVKAGEEAARQLLNYVRFFKVKGRKVRGVLLAPSFTEQCIKLLSASGLEYKQIDIRRIYELVKERATVRRSSLLSFVRD